jgi:hypothetical protein
MKFLMLLVRSQEGGIGAVSNNLRRASAQPAT